MVDLFSVGLLPRGRGDSIQESGEFRRDGGQAAGGADHEAIGRAIVPNDEAGVGQGGGEPHDRHRVIDYDYDLAAAVLQLLQGADDVEGIASRAGGRAVYQLGEAAIGDRVAGGGMGGMRLWGARYNRRSHD
jgi:hypothetical protein